jgi:type IV pilus assembly protein PilW
MKNKIYRPSRFGGAVRLSSKATGFTLIEILIALLLSLIAILVIGQVFSLSESRKRITSGAADAQQAASVNLFQTGRLTRMGGSGLTQGDSASQRVWGCNLSAAFNSNALSPLTKPRPFENLPSATSIFPAVVYRGQGFAGNAATPQRIGDVLAIFGGNSGAGQVQFEVAGTQSSTTALVVSKTALGVKAGDRLLAFSSGRCVMVQADPDPALFQEVAANTTLANLTRIALGGPYNLAAGVPSLPLPSEARVINLGQAPNFFLLGVNDQNQLVQFDVLNTAGIATNVPQVIAENVVDFRAVIGVRAPRGSALRWLPAGNTDYTPAKLAAKPTLADDIYAVRVAIVLRSPEPHNDSDAPTSYVVFPENADLRQEVSLDTTAARYRYQVYDTTIPVRNINYVPAY